jgi:membrane protein DedA with SNARE-associated domain
MIEGIVGVIASWTMNLVSSLGYLGIFLAMAIESACIPLPSEIIMPFSGFLVSAGRFNFFLVVFFGAAGNLFGSVLVYWLGSWGQERFVRVFVKGWGRFLVSEEELEAGERWLRRYGDPVIFISRILPVVRTFISLPAGIAKVNFGKFCLFTFVGSFLWSALLAYVGVKLGENWAHLEPIFRKFDIVIVLVGIIGVVAYLYFKFRRGFYAKKNLNR